MSIQISGSTNTITSNTGAWNAVTDVTFGSIAAAGPISLTSVPFIQNNKIISANYTVGATNNVMSIGPATINTGITVTISTGGRWVIV